MPCLTVRVRSVVLMDGEAAASERRLVLKTWSRETEWGSCPPSSAICRRLREETGL